MAEEFLTQEEIDALLKNLAAQARGDSRRVEPHGGQLEHANAGVDDRAVTGAAAQVA